MIDYDLFGEMASIYDKELAESLEMAIYTFGTDILLNNVPKRVVLQNRKGREGNEKVIYCKVREIDIGDEISDNDQNWLAVSYPVEVKSYAKVFVKRCNATLSIPQSKAKIKVGQDWRNIPKYEDQNTNHINVSCVVESVIYESDGAGSEKAINLPNGQIMITLPYNQYSKNIKLDFNFDIFGDKYKVVRIGRNHIISERGILILTCELDE